MKLFRNLHSYFLEILRHKFRTLKAIFLYPNVQIFSGVVIGSNCKFGHEVKVYKNSVLSNSSVGDYSYIGSNSEIKNCRIGKFCSIASNVKIGLGIHPVDIISTYPGFYSQYASGVVKFGIDKSIIEEKIVQVGNDVWIGTNSIILDGVIIGNGVVIAAGSVVTKNIEPYSIVGGVPARLIRMRFEQDQIDMLENFKWWDRGLDFCKKNSQLFLDPKEFFLKFNKR